MRCLNEDENEGESCDSVDPSCLCDRCAAVLAATVEAAARRQTRAVMIAVAKLIGVERATALAWDVDQRIARESD